MNLTDSPWYRPCPVHRAALARLPFEQAYEIARECEECKTGVGVTR